MKDINDIATKLGLELTERGNLEIGSHDAGHWSPPGGAIRNSAVTYYLMADGDYRVVIDDRRGSNQGYPEWHRGDKVRLDSGDLAELIDEARDYISGMENSEVMQAWRLASNEARATMRRADRD